MTQRLSATLAIVLTAVAWPIGIFFLWRSSAWTRTEKVLGTLVIPGGVWTAFLLEAGDRSSCPIAAAGASILGSSRGLRLRLHDFLQACPDGQLLALAHSTDHRTEQL
jgi:hypothetical protein